MVISFHSKSKQKRFQKKNVFDIFDTKTTDIFVLLKNYIYSIYTSILYCLLSFAYFVSNLHGRVQYEYTRPSNRLSISLSVKIEAHIYQGV